ncbi:MAG TPA: hypothetical protein VEK05_16455 [Burkholderiales bacterium]|nr:hypothetical protein [Burkholderiales bacterium]
MSRASTRLAVMALHATLVLGACKQPEPRPAPTPQAAEVTEPAAAAPAQKPPFTRQPVGDADRLVAYYGYLTTLSPEQLTREYERTLRFYREQNSDLAFMQLALLRTMPNTTFRDSTQARDMLSSFVKEPRLQSSDLQPLALLLLTMLNELQDKDAEIQAQAQRLKEETKRSDVVKQKLDALIDAERKMLERNKPVRSQ